MKTKTAIFAIVCALAFGFAATNAQAEITLSPASGNPPLILIGPGTPSTGPGNSGILAYLTNQGYDLSTELYKQNVSDGFDTGPFASSYTTTFNGDASGGSITWVGAPAPYIHADPLYLLVKDGNNQPIWYFYNLGNIWDGQETLKLQDFWPSNGSISHVALYGTSTTVPDGGMTLILLGGALVGLETVRRRFRA
jgi:hypothetical protein